MNRLLAIFSLAIPLLLLAVGNAEAQVSVQRSRQTVTHDGHTFFLHTVKRSQTVFSIAKAYNVSQEAVIYYNPFAAEGIKTRQSLLIPDEDTYRAWKGGKKAVDLKEKKQEKQQQDIPPPADDEDTGIRPTAPEDEDDRQPETASAHIPFDGTVRAPVRKSEINVAMLLPFVAPGTGSNEDFSDFYRGALLALGSLKNEGISVNLDLMSTERSVETTNEIINSGKLDGADLIIGPVYGDQFAPVARFAAENRIPVVSPLGSVGEQEVPYVFEVAPSARNKYDKLRPVVNDPENNVFMIRPANIDQAAYDEMQYIIPKGIPALDGRSEEAIKNLLARDRENVIILPTSTQRDVESILASIQSVNITQRYRITVIGTSRWAGMMRGSDDLPLEKYYLLNVTYVTSYHADRSSQPVHEFYRQYIGAFSGLPSSYSFRGYDVTRYFVTALNAYGETMPRHIGNHAPALLQVRYSFAQNGPESKFTNREWMVVRYRNNFSIEVY